MVSLFRGAGHSYGGGHCGEQRTSFTSWFNEIDALNELSLSPFVMQSNADFSMEGSLSANCHGWQNNAGPFGNHITDLIVDRGNGPEKATEEIQSAVTGGWGLCGEIVDFNYKSIPNFKVASLVSSSWAEQVVGDDYDCDMLNIHLDDKFEKAVVNEHYYSKQIAKTKLTDNVPKWVPWMVRYCPWLRWFAQSNFNTRNTSNRNQMLYTSVDHFDFRNRKGERITELFEIFIPQENAAEYVRLGKQHMAKIPNYNTTVRHIEEDKSSILSYAKGPTRGFVTLAKKKDTNRIHIRKLIDLAISLGGSYYLPYNMYASVPQFQKCYGRWEEFKKYQIVESPWSKKYLGAMN